MKVESALTLILAELERAEKLHPVWPNSLIHVGLIVSEENGELAQAILNHSERKGSKAQIITEAVHTAAMALRLLKNITEEESHHE